VGFATVLAAGFLIILSLAITAAIAAVEKFFASLLPIPGGVLQLINSVVSLGISTFLFALLFQTLPGASGAAASGWARR
jgi:membrane protein